jgi:Arc/MetJ family transcription regulator
MSRTNIDIDDELIKCVMQRYGLRTKREAVEFALRQIAPKPLTPEEFLALEGTGWGDEDLDAETIKYSPVREW